MKYIKLILILPVLISCSTSKSIVGLYGKCEKSYFACTQIELKLDKTFEFFIFMDVGGRMLLKGHWEQVSNDSVKLNTFEQPKNPKTTFKGKINPNRTNIQIKIIESESPLGAAFIVLNNQNHGTSTDMNGIIKVKSQEIETITYHYLGRKETIQMDNPRYNEIEITIRDLDSSAFPQFLTDTIIRVYKQKLFFEDGFFLKKTKFQNKQWE